MTTREEMIQEAKAYNNCLTDEFFKGKTNQFVYNNTHSAYRDKYYTVLSKLKIWHETE